MAVEFARVRATKAAETYRSGVTVWGVNLHTQVGHDEDTSPEYVLEKGKFLCGSGANPPSAKMVAAGRG